ncbi:hypothetical protein, partial [Vibrio cholerae]|uniref:hypothetical protein n=1 Tax=Vibrio cholerae TaxID=666 RepID=UPI002271B634
PSAGTVGVIILSCLQPIRKPKTINDTIRIFILSLLNKKQELIILVKNEKNRFIHFVKFIFKNLTS